eukprot:CAMPEP_0198261942 /NCGR_PEP_ID=MMETSP1447-20131203/10543_1 /TAXON_ID=420782 /ORGANISM="Chaetoceros dichaeta, Strain CCMP1751" /LENGTH=395 /DNA_ID=CAMNT_0043950001 /DNA_START=53 /DNA_END=1240 /DNA_ORIENTATION=-
MVNSNLFRRMLSSLFGFLFLSISATAAIDYNDNSSIIQKNLISWVRSKGGIFSDKLEIRRVDPAVPTSYMGVFVTEPIDAKEVLMVIPRDCYIHIFDTAVVMDWEDTTDGAYQENSCQLATKLMDEMKLGKDSRYAPYIAYLKTQSVGQLPINWSREGKDLLRNVAIPGSRIVDWNNRDFKDKTHDCIGKNNNTKSAKITFEEHMVEMTRQRGFDTALIPIWDMVNHDNGKINTENDSFNDAGGLRVRAARNLAEGEEVYASYDKCPDCFDIEYYWGTPEILRDFGFVEDYPHRWVFYDYDIWFEVYEDYKFNAHFDIELGAIGEIIDVPSEEQIEFLKDELARLEEVGESLLKYQGSLLDREWSIILQFQKAAVIDMRIVIKWYTTSGDSNAEK